VIDTDLADATVYSSTGALTIADVNINSACTLFCVMKRIRNNMLKICVDKCDTFLSNVNRNLMHLTACSKFSPHEV
jgi:hypothetical protein